MADHFQQIYSSRAADYHRLIEPEDVDGNLLPALETVTALHGKRVLDLGSGTGRLPLLFGMHTAQTIALDLYWDMLREQREQRRRAAGDWDLVQGDMRALPVPTGWADVVTAGWAVGHMRTWFADDWRAQAGSALREMHRVLAPGGALIIIETLTTGGLVPAPPTPELAEYYAWLETEWGLARQTIRTDYQFASVEQAMTRTAFFFGPTLAAAIREHGWARLPEWTGVWGKRMTG